MSSNWLFAKKVTKYEIKGRVATKKEEKRGMMVSKQFIPFYRCALWHSFSLVWSVLRKGSEIHENKVFVEIVLSISFDICFFLSVIEKVIEKKTKIVIISTNYIQWETAGVPNLKIK